MHYIRLKSKVQAAPMSELDGELGVAHLHIALKAMNERTRLIL